MAELYLSLLRSLHKQGNMLNTDRPISQGSVASDSLTVTCQLVKYDYCKFTAVEADSEGF